MSDFFKKIGKTISDTSKNVKESVSDSREKSNLRRQIDAASNKIEQMKISMGDRVYNAYRNDTELEDCINLCRAIDSLLADIEKYKAQILAIDGIKKCDACGMEISVESSFCSHCGAKQTPRQNEQENSEENGASSDNAASDESGYVDVTK